MKIHHKQRELHVVPARNMDMRVMYLYEHFFAQDKDTDEIFLIKTKILTVDGWRDHTPGVEFDIRKLPTIDGRDLWIQDNLEKALKKWEMLIAEYIGDRSRENDGTSSDSDRPGNEKSSA